MPFKPSKKHFEFACSQVATDGDAVTQPSSQNRIEMAMDRVTAPSPSTVSEPDTIRVDTRSIWRREQDRALKQRLEQLQIT